MRKKLLNSAEKWVSVCVCVFALCKRSLLRHTRRHPSLLESRKRKRERSSGWVRVRESEHQNAEAGSSGKWKWKSACRKQRWVVSGEVSSIAACRAFVRECARERRRERESERRTQFSRNGDAMRCRGSSISKWAEFKGKSEKFCCWNFHLRKKKRKTWRLFLSFNALREIWSPGSTEPKQDHFPHPHFPPLKKRNEK